MGKLGGKGEIRTHGALLLAGFQDQCLKPLGHFSKIVVIVIVIVIFGGFCRNRPLAGK